MVSSYRLYGQAMLDHLRGGPGKFTFLRDDGLRDPSDVRDLFRACRDWRPDEREAIRWARGRVLDVGCGAGRAALYLQRRGLSVVSIDASAEAVECARLRGGRDVRRMDARRLLFSQQSFDTLLMFGNNFGICGGFDATRRFLREARRITRRHGLLIASTRTPGSWLKPHAEYVKRNVRKGRSPGLIRLRMVYGRRTGTWFQFLLVSPDDALRLCEATGWDIQRIIPGGRGIADYAFVAQRSD